MPLGFLYGRLMRLAAVLALGVSSAFAADDGDELPAFSFHGFGTLGAVTHDTPGVQFIRETSQASGARANRISTTPDSMLGAQLGARLNDRFGAAVQLVSRLNTENNYNPKVTWAYLKYMPDDETTVRLGRLGMDMLAQGDAVYIDYANLTVRPSVVFYPQSFDGADAEIIQPWGDGLLHLKGFAGWETGKRIASAGTSAYNLSGSKVFGGLVQYDKNGWSGRVSVNRLILSHAQAELQPGSAMYEALSSLPNGARILDKLSPQDRSFDTVILALSYDDGPLRGMLNYGEFSSQDWPTRHIFQSNIGYRIGDVTPYLAYTWQHTSRQIIPSGLPDGPASDLLNQVSALAQNSPMFNQTNAAVGVRYDFADNMALKLQVDRFRYRDPDNIYDPATISMAVPVATRAEKSLTLFSVALNFIF